MAYGTGDAGGTDGDERVRPGRFELGTDGPNTIIVGIDGSDTSMRAGAYAAGLARRQGSRLICVHVRQTPALAYGAEIAAAAAVTNDQVSGEIRELLRRQAAGWRVDADFLSADGDPYSVIIAVAQEVSADAIVVGASTHFGHRITGSLAIRLVKCGRWPVTVVP